MNPNLICSRPECQTTAGCKCKERHVTISNYLNSVKQATRDWQPIESAPKNGEAILIANSRHQGQHRVAWFDDANPTYPWHVEDAANGFNHHKDWPTHWRPLLPDPLVTK